MKESIEITPNTSLRIKENKLVLRENNRIRVIELENIEDMHCRGRKTIPAYILYKFLHEGIAIYCYEGNGRFLGGTIPHPKLCHSADLVISQTEYRQDSVKRLVLVRELEKGIKHNILWLLKKYKNMGFAIDKYVDTIFSITLEDLEEVNQFKNREGRMWKNFYTAFGLVVPGWGFIKRTRRPPKDPISAMISYGNQVLYGKIQALIHTTSLHQGIGYIHETKNNKRSLSFDIADLFKTIIVYPTLSHLVHWQLIKKSHFEQEGEEVRLNEVGKRILRKELLKKLNERIKHPQTLKKHSLSLYINQELYKLINHLIGNKLYTSFKAWW